MGGCGLPCVAHIGEWVCRGHGRGSKRRIEATPILVRNHGALQFETVHLKLEIIAVEVSIN